MAALFDVNTDRLSLGALDVPAIGTAAIWAYPNFAYNDGVRHEVYNASKDASNFGIQLFKHTDSNWYAGWYTAGVEYRVITSASALVQSAWNLLTLTWDDTANETKLYVGNVQQGSTVTSLATYTGNTDFQIGNLQGQNIGWANGRLSDFAIWNVVLTSDQRAALLKFDPLLIAPASIFRHCALRSTLIETRTGTAISNTGATIGDGPPLIRRKRRKAA